MSERKLVRSGDNTYLHDPVANTSENLTDFVATDAEAAVVLQTAEARTATADGLTTGIISDSADIVTVTSANADHIITLPTPTPGRRVTLVNAGTGYELRSSAPATVAINGGSGASAESAIGANVVVECRCVSATRWICNNYSTAGAVTATEAAA